MKQMAGSLLLLSALALATAPAQAQKGGSKVEPRSDMPSWFIFHATGKAPDRSIYIVDARHQQVGDNVYQTQALVMRETPSGDFDHWSGTLQYQAGPEQVELARGPLDKMQPLLKSVKVRTVSGYQMQGNGRVIPAQPSDWTAFKTPIDLLGFRIAADPEAVKDPTRYAMVFTGNFHRPIDVVDVVRRVLPNVKQIQ